MARAGGTMKDLARGERFRAICQGLFPGQPRAAIAEMFGGVSGGTIRNWELGYNLSSDALSRLEDMGVSIVYLLKGEGPPMIPLPDAPDSIPEIGEESFPSDPKYLAKVVGANLKYLRKQRFPGWGGQKRFAAFLGISANDLCVYEYGRGLPNEQRLAEMASRLQMTPEDLFRPLPGITVAPPPKADYLTGPLASAERAWREKADELRQTAARLEGRLEILESQNTQLYEMVQNLQEANYVLRNLLYVEDSPEASKRREKMLGRLAPSIAELVKKVETF